MKLKISSQKKTKAFQTVDEGNLNLHESLKLLRRSVGKNQEQYAKMVKVSVRTIKDFEQGHSNPTLETLNKLFLPFGYEIGLKKIRRL